MKNEIILSVIVPVWNQEILLKRALESIPIRHDIEVLIIDDGSTDGTQSTIKAYIEAHPDMRVRVFTNEKNIGLARSESSSKVSKNRVPNSSSYPATSANSLQFFRQSNSQRLQE